MNKIDITLQAVANRFLEFFDNMPSVPIVIGNQDEFPDNVLAHYRLDRKEIRVSPTWVKAQNMEDMHDTIIHELTHAWVDWQGLHTDFAKGHNEWFLWKTYQVAKETIDKFTSQYPEVAPIVEKIKRGWTPGEPDPIGYIPPSEDFRPELHRPQKQPLPLSPSPSQPTNIEKFCGFVDGLSENTVQFTFVFLVCVVIAGGLFWFESSHFQTHKRTVDDVIMERVAAKKVVWDTPARSGYLYAIGAKLIDFQKANNREPTETELVQIVDAELNKPPQQTTFAERARRTGGQPVNK